MSTGLNNMLPRNIVPAFFYHIKRLLVNSAADSTFFFSWNIISVSLIFGVIEFKMVPSKLIGPLEHLIFNFLLFVMMHTRHDIKIQASSSYVSRSKHNVFSTDDEMCCPCVIKKPARNYLRIVCDVCILRRHDHCSWINCRIEKSNHKLYFRLLVVTSCWLLLATHLLLTTACDSELYNNSFLVPVDCRNVFVEDKSGYFVMALYCSGAFLLILFNILVETVLILTKQEFRQHSADKV